MKVLIYGFGRMGLTHYSILNALNPNLDFTIIEPNKMLSVLLKSNLNCELRKDDEGLKDGFDLTLITTPPFLHTGFLQNSLDRGDKKIFIEKPFGGHRHKESDLMSPNVYIGYVLRFNPCIQWIKKNIDPADIVAIKGQYLSNTIEKKPNGWRNGEYSGVLNEMGSHIIDLINYLIDIQDYSIVKANKQSVVSDVDDIVEATITSGDKDVSLYLNWVKKEIRKPVFGLEIMLKSGEKLFADQQTIKIYNGEELVRKVAVTDLAETVPFYLRGIDFTKQMQDLLGDSTTLCTMTEALKVNSLMSNILEQ